jgi:hypothetical protein
MCRVVVSVSSGGAFGSRTFGAARVLVKRARSNLLSDLDCPLPKISNRQLLELPPFGDADENVHHLIVFFQLICSCD